MPPMTMTSGKRDPLLGNAQHHSRSCTVTLLCGLRLVDTSSVGHHNTYLSPVASDGMGEGGMLCCHGVSLEVKVQAEGLNCATKLGQGHNPLPAPDRLF